jgi:alpha-beta hydrolase superfamily lysophospholipase
MIAIVIVLALAWLVLSPRLVPGLYMRFLLRPEKNCGSPEDKVNLLALGGEEIYFSNGRGQQLRGYYFACNTEAPQSSSMILYSIGNDGDIEKRASVLALLLKTGVPVFIYEYSGFGKSQGKPSLKNAICDSHDAFDFVVERFNKKTEEIVLYGESLGGAISARLLSSRSAGALILKSSFSSLARISRELCVLLRIYPSILLPLMDTGKRLQSVVVPVMIIHGHLDRKIHWKHAETLYSNCQANKTLLWLPNSRHAYMTEADEEIFYNGLSMMLEAVSKSTAMINAHCQYYDWHELGVLEELVLAADSEAGLQQSIADYRQTAESLSTFACAVSGPDGT